MASVLDEIAARRAADIASTLGDQDWRSVARGSTEGPPRRDVAGRLARPGLHLIAEIKRRAPSAGTLADDKVDIAARARAYQAGGASMISVLVEPHWFGGSIDDLRTARAATSLPVLAKDFVVDDRQLPVLRAAGADAVLLLAALHTTPRARPGWRHWPSSTASSRSWRRTPPGSWRRRWPPTRDSSASTTATCGRSRPTRSSPCGCAARPDGPPRRRRIRRP